MLSLSLELIKYKWFIVIGIRSDFRQWAGKRRKAGRGRKKRMRVGGTVRDHSHRNTWLQYQHQEPCKATYVKFTCKVR